MRLGVKVRGPGKLWNTPNTTITLGTHGTVCVFYKP